MREGKTRPKSRKKIEPGREALVALFQDNGIQLDPAMADRFWQFHQLLRARNQELDLTRIHNFEAMVLKHYVDSILPGTLTDLPSPLLDIGTGAGFPGIPLKIFQPDLHIILAEGRARRLAFLEEAIATLNLTGVSVYPHKVTENFDLPIKGIITRDFESVAKTLKRAIGFLPQGGKAVFMKGPSVDPELDQAGREFKSDFELIEDRAYTIGEAGLKRRLVVYQRRSRVSRKIVESKINIKEIASPRNPEYKIWQSLLSGRGIKKHGLALLSGPKQIDEMLDEFPERIKAVLWNHRDSFDPFFGPDQYCLRPEIFRELDVFGAGPPLMVVEVPDMPEFESELPAGATLFIPFQDPSNVGAVIRSAAALGASQAVLLAEAAHPFHPKSLRAAGPTVYRLFLKKGPALAGLADVKFPIIVLSGQGQSLIGYPFPEKFGLVPGLEGPGLPDALLDKPQIAVPMEPAVESLNAAVAASIALYEWRRKQDV
jgi:16S rRNA (guanine(527)-N(7))-methyltransferase RsmG